MAPPTPVGTTAAARGTRADTAKGTATPGECRRRLIVIHRLWFPPISCLNDLACRRPIRSADEEGVSISFPPSRASIFHWCFSHFGENFHTGSFEGRGRCKKGCDTERPSWKIPSSLHLLRAGAPLWFFDALDPLKPDIMVPFTRGWVFTRSLHPASSIPQVNAEKDKSEYIVQD